jgi:hypothetical protein
MTELMRLIESILAGGSRWRISGNQITMLTPQGTELEAGVIASIREAKPRLLHALPPDYPAPNANAGEIENWMRAELNRMDSLPEEAWPYRWRLFVDAESQYIELHEKEAA